MTPDQGGAAAWEAAADALYAADLATFIPARDEAARGLKAAGDETGAKRLKALKKPSLAAWALNQLVREDRVQVDALLAIGGELRQAQTALSGDDLRMLTSQRHKVVRAVAVRAAELARAAGHPLSPALVEQVARSLDAALTDPAAAAALVEGRLVTDLAYAGLGDTATVGFPALSVVRDSDAPGADSAKSESAAAKAARRRALKAAEQAATEAATALEAAEESLARAREAADAANLRAATAEETVTAAQAELEAAQQAETVAERALALADKTYDRAGTRHADAQARLDDLRR